MNPFNVLKKIFTNPFVLGLMVAVSIYVYITVEQKERKIENGFSATACADSSIKVISTLRKITSKEDPNNYLLQAKGFTNKANYTGRSIPNNTSITVIDTLESHPEIVQIHIRRNNPTSINPRNEYLWIWEGYICK